MAAGDFLTLAEAKVFLGFGDTTYDNAANAWLPVIQNFVMEFTGNDFGGVFPAGLKLPVVRLIGYLLQSPGYPQPFKRGDVSVFEDAVFDQFRKDLKQWKLAKFI